MPAPWRQIALWLLVVVTVGYTHGLAYVAFTSGGTHTGLEDRYRGNQSMQSPDTQPSEMKFAKSTSEVFSIIHTHILGMSSMFLYSSIVFSFCSLVGGRWKKFLLFEPFFAILTTFAAMWLMWGVHPAFSWLLILSSGSMAVIFYVTVALSLWELVVVGGKR
jgi:hypothetical protein